ncbi:MAG: flagellar export protein FliJ [Pirellulaceae bacterium]|nr:flagellar export protein FliJ [Pirellulaceae bacterium]
MSTFRFRLETLLRLRTAERDERRADLAKAQRALAVLQGQADDIDLQRGELATQTRQLSSPGEADIDALVRTHRHELVLRTQRAHVAGQLTQVAAELERRRQVLVEADRQVRVLEKLRQRQQAAHRQRQDKLEMKQLDEQAAQGFLRQEAAT